MPAAVPIIVAGAVGTGAAAAVGTAIAGAAISTAAATAIGAGVIATGASLATGKDVGESLQAGVVSGLTAGIGSSIGAAADAAFVAADAAQLAGQGLSEAAIAQNLVASGVTSTAAQTAAQLAASGATEAAISSSLGSGTFYEAPAVSGGAEVTPVQPPAEQVVTPIGETTASVDYSLLGGQAQLPSGMGGGTGITADLPPIVEPIGSQPIDYSLTPQTTPGISGGIGLQLPEAPNIAQMGGGQGLLAPVEGGTVGQLGLISEGATPVLGSPSSIINQPDVLGTPVLQQGTPRTISIQDALRGARLVNSLLTPQQPQVPNMLGRAQEALAQQGGVDYNALLGLLNQQASTAGLLGTRFQPQSINIASLLG